jgi:hypothetical protein
VGIEAQLAELHHCKFTLEIEQCVTVDLTNASAQGRDVTAIINHEGQPQVAFTKASQNVAASAALLDTLPVPSTNRVDRVYHQLKDILGITTAPQVESSLHC